MKNNLKKILVPILLVQLSACASVLPGEPAKDNELSLIRQDKTTRLYARPGFDPQRFGEYALDRVEVQVTASANALQKIEQEKLGAQLQTQLRQLIAPPASAARLNMEVRLHDIEPVTPALNMVSIVLAFVPLDTGAMTLETTYRDVDGVVQARRIERLSGSIFNIKASFSEYGQHKIVLSEWAQNCALSEACLSATAE
jgi:hypothetical protein